MRTWLLESTRTSKKAAAAPPEGAAAPTKRTRTQVAAAQVAIEKDKEGVIVIVVKYC